MSTHFPVVDLDPISATFGAADVPLSKLLPAYNDIPEEFRRGRTKWNRLFSDWFFGGLEKLELIPHEGIDKNRALIHIRAVMGSFEPKHEHKEAGVSYLLSQWFTDASTWKVKPRKSEGCNP